MYTENNTTKAIKILQINIDKKQIALDLLHQFVREQNTDIVLGQEPGKRIPTAAIVDKLKNCFIWIPKNNKNITHKIIRNGIVGVEIKGTLYISCYFSPNKTIEEFETFLEDLENIIRVSSSPVVVGGDFNAKSGMCGSLKTDGRGDKLEEIILSNGLVCLNDGKITFSNANGSSLIDLTLVSDRVFSCIAEWEVLHAIDSGSEHSYITFNVKQQQQKTIEPDNLPKGWILTPTGKERLAVGLEREKIPTAMTEAHELVESISSCCDKYLKQKKELNTKYKPVYWWSKEIEVKRKESHKARRAFSRAMSKRIPENLMALAKDKMKDTRKELKTLIRKGKERCWKELCAELDEDIWGRGYKIASKKLRQINTVPITNEETLLQVRKLFPCAEKRMKWTRLPSKVVEDQATNKEEVDRIIKDLKNKKAPGPDCITPEILKVVKEKYLTAITSVMNKHLLDATFPDTWKISRLVLLEKPRKNDEEKSYRPICIMDTLGKVLEKLINVRLQTELERNGTIHANQFGFQKGKSSLDALQSVQEVVENIKTRSYKNQECCVIVTLDVRNAFNSAPWTQIVHSLKKANLSEYLVNLCQEYLTNRKILLPSGQSFNMTCGVPQGSVLGPTLWNIFYDKIIRTTNEKSIKIVAYADDLAVVISGRNSQTLEETATYILTELRVKLGEMGLDLAKQKTEATVLRGWRRCLEMEIKIDDTVVKIEKAAKYMGITINNNWHFHSHVNNVKKKTQDMIRYLGRLTLNREGPRTAKKRMLVSAVHSVMLYGATIWGEVMKYKAHENTMETINRKLALMVTGAYRTSPTAAILVLAKIPPVKLMVEERIEVHKKVKEKNQLKQEMIEKWHTIWQNYHGHAKTYLPDLRDWIQKEWAETDHTFSQVVTGHGCFGSFLYRIGKRSTPKCWYCGDDNDTTEHTLFECPRWEENRLRMDLKVGTNIDRANIGTILLRNQETWTIIKEFINKIMNQKLMDEKGLLKD